jgi:hypothetical protein
MAGKKHDNENLKAARYDDLDDRWDRSVHLQVTMAVSEELSYIAFCTFIISDYCSTCQLGT